MKHLLPLALLLLLFVQLPAQTFVSTTPSNRNVIIEEFTGRNCQYCPDGHRIANEIVAANPGRVWAINIHAGSFAASTYPNFLTTDGTTIHDGFSISGYPCGAVNRSSTTALNRGQWSGTTNIQLAQASEVNIGGVCIVNTETRLATIIVEVYYTANSSASTNQLTVAMLQNNILGSQSGMSSNPSQIINGQYNHMHIMRDVITTSAWGETIEPTTEGTLIQKVYEYQIPENIGTPNGVDVVFEDLQFLAWVSTNNYNILSVNELTYIIDASSNQNVNPLIANFAQESVVICDNNSGIDATIMNIGNDNITSMEYTIDYGDIHITDTWEGNIAKYETAIVNLPIYIDDDYTTINITILKANGIAITPTANSTKELELFIPEGSIGIGHKVTLMLWHDKYGNQVTWQIVNYDNSVIANGGPYTQLATDGTRLIMLDIDIEAEDCYKFEIFDSEGDGINNGHGDGHYILKGGNGQIIHSSDGTYEDYEYVPFSVFFSSPAEVSVNIEGQGYALGSGNYSVGSTATLTAYPINDYTFGGWIINGETVCTDAEYSFTVEADITVKAVFNSPVGINEQVSSIKIYPNPASNAVTIYNTVNLKSVLIYNTTGQLVIESGNSSTINISSLSKGLYFMIINDNNNITEKNIVVE
ncbi:MAG: Omp28-related outer membrane protein [Bacteroidales bacterium]|jgi:hypothetical protein|nr:Omp28-related outer membrane protein [Bacteroidales bacterium]MDD2205221.1 Omp28-related outer membrane protein [Bacteroidales bacterium]MDD3914672.1 Omp28-related outer membrane protein [Bacteroidales bacterium]MDD4633393.1 Omp28-related outer membrane protein [Bacteroidales bacterium]